MGLIATVTEAGEAGARTGTEDVGPSSLIVSDGFDIASHSSPGASVAFISASACES